MKKTLSGLLILLLALSIAGCAGGAANAAPTQAPASGTASLAQPTAEPAAQPTPEPEKTIDTVIIGTTMEVLSANRSEYNFDVISGTLSQLAPVWIDESGEYRPLLCDYATGDSRIWTLTVREDMTWHDGEPVTAEDIRFTLEYLDAQLGGGYADAYAAIRVTGERTIELELDAPNPRLLASLTTLRILPKHIYDGVADYTTVENERANIGCGPYRYVRFDAAAGVVEFAAYAAYPDGRPAAEHVLLQLFDSEDTMYMALKAGQIDMVYKYSGGVSAAVISDLAACPNLTLLPVANTANSAVLIFNNSREPLTNAAIRKAIAKAIDYAAFRTTFGSPYAVASRAGFVPEGSYGYVETPVLERDVDEARRLLAQAGCTDLDGDGVLEYNGARLSIPVMLRGDKPAHQRYAELVKNNLAEVGIEITLDVREVADFRELTEKERAQSAVITGLTPYGMSMQQGLSSLYLWGEYPMGYGQVYDPAYRALLDRADDAADMDAYRAVAGEIQNYYAETLPAIALFWDAHVQAYQSRFDGFVVDGTFGILNAQTWMRLTENG